MRDLLLMEDIEVDEITSTVFYGRERRGGVCEREGVRFTPRVSSRVHRLTLSEMLGGISESCLDGAYRGVKKSI